jgi:large subunit ribosomal protein L23
MNPYKVLIQPVDTEKTRFQASELGQYTFEVATEANKIEVKKAVETVFDVDVVDVHMMVVPGKVTRRYGRQPVVRRAPWKKAIVTIAPGQRIDVFEGV